MQNSKASKMLFDSQPLGSVICSNCIDYNLILLIFKGDVLTSLPMFPYVPIEVTPPPRVGTSLMDTPTLMGAVSFRKTRKFIEVVIRIVSAKE